MACKCKNEEKLILALTSPEATEPVREHALTDSGMDLFSTKEVIIPPNSRALISTGVKAYIPEGYELQVRSKSGLALKSGVFVLNSPGTIDRGYANEIGVILFNTDPREEYVVKAGQKVAQLVMCPVCIPTVVRATEEEVDELNSTMDRGLGGFGSTGLFKK